MNEWIPRIPLADWIDRFVDWLTSNFGGIFDGVATGLEGLVNGIVSGLGFIPPILLSLIIAGIAWWLTKKSIALFSLIGFLIIDYLGYWDAMLSTLALVLTSVIISVVVGIPIGIWASQKDTVRKIVTPILDFMQTMPAFVYLLPAIFFFNIGVVPGVVASVIFAMPPTIRLTILGIQQVPEDIIEATESFGSTTSQRLLKVQLPLATPTIMAGINQSIMLALSMVVIASMVGAPGLGEEVYRAVTQLKTGVGVEAGLTIVIVAIVLDRITQNAGKKKQRGN
ncbi:MULTISPECIES: glycine/proline betaine ABC transporter permease subunit OpuAB [Heyndrickxia]|jgi:glycine betaine/proline transport system permease protein|uniref:Glycine/betaine ABC transporter n=1 Tax=Heyndrickxia oleronia TaxID=38875 RepID=A0A8E2IBQ6_9BACI|nr:glycine/proline betaine ABC transporter permease subunit OpuAB [Heyndrickxia oleronia]NYV64950.1 proline/glycine betaine ABC transporter permease [Bacillus sp. Gen3]OJH19439.1 glycine/betaine ABC transporter [Bacillus obstructivus]MBU5210368.1 glycine/proline betaine ABC transporter permease subunit OpuAB [Heyndrickxia oleronia]MCI1590728.1 glycine/proline betaine ABC transporter permease subunit OpuAB [Heyndrickxia oleronia]MCI1612083.1 glycine/proline betaine ABC transporter permease subu